MDDVWTISPNGAAGRVELTLRAASRPLVAVLSDAEFASVRTLLPEVAETVQRGEFSRVRLGTAFRNTIGRDPFRQMTGAPAQRGLFAWWADCAYVVIGLSFAADHSHWLRFAGYVFAAGAFGDLVGHARRRLRRQPRR
ncbi:hypothetical protein KRMM14A1004_45590 [Krasilnikovia sp. MM14-A1004]